MPLPFTTDEFLSQMHQPIQTPFGSVMEAVNLGKERVRQILGQIPTLSIGPNPYGPQESAKSEDLSKKVLDVVTNILPYETTVAGSTLGQISPVYHGSPYKFNKFKNEAIGTGEGAQAFGYGHYFSEAPEVASHYKMTSEPEVRVITKYRDFKTGSSQNEIERQAGDIIRSQGSIDEALKYLDAFNKKRGPYDPEVDDLLSTLQNWKKNAKIEIINAKEGSLYEATLHKGKKPGEYKYLPWDIVPEEIFKDISLAIEKEFPNTELLSAIKAYGKYGEGHRLGANVYNTLSDYLGGQKQASAFLQRSGISGIKYPAGSLSGVKSDKFNYVVFDPEDIFLNKMNGKELIEEALFPTALKEQIKQRR